MRGQKMKWLLGFVATAVAAAAYAQFGNWDTKTIQVKDALTFRGTGVLGLSDTVKNWDTKQIQVKGPLTFRGTGVLGLTATEVNWDTKQVQTGALIFRGTGRLQ
jgi:hypothetical protein